MAQTTKTTRRKSARNAPTSLKSFNPQTGEVLREIPADDPKEVA